MAVVSLPLTFYNSFWSQDYRKGLRVIFEKLEQGTAENDEIVAFVRARAAAEGQFAASLKRQPTSKAGTGFDADDGASLLMAFRGLQAETADHGQLHEAISTELNDLVADPFENWTKDYKDRLAIAKAQALGDWITSFEENCGHVDHLRHEYIEKSRIADEAEDDARFVSNEVTDRYTSPTSSPRAPSHRIRGTPNRQPTLSERVTQRLRGLGMSAASAVVDKSPPAPPLQVFDAEAEKPLNSERRLDKGKGKATEADLVDSPAPMSPSLPKLSLTTEPDSEDVQNQNRRVLFANREFTHKEISELLTKAKSDMLSNQPSLFGFRYKEHFDGKKICQWLLDNVTEFKNDPNLVLRAARGLMEAGYLKRIGEPGNKFDDSDQVDYELILAQSPSVQAGTNSPPVASPLQRFAPELAKTSGALVDIVSKALSSSAEPPFVRCRREATNAEGEYRKAIRSLDRHRLKLEEMIETTLKSLQGWESDRLHAVKSVLLQYQGSIANLRKSYDASADRSSTLISAYNPDSDLKALIERYRTGPFRPKAYVFESIAHEEGDVVFGIDLRKWAEGGWGSDEVRKESLPPVLTMLLGALEEAYEKISDDSEKRKAWIYEVPLNAVHHVRELLNSMPHGQESLEDALGKYDVPVLASAVKLWLLELEPPLGLYDAWDEFRKIYPSIGSATKVEQSEEERLEVVVAALLKFPRINLLVLDAVLQHLKDLIVITKTGESNEVYISKLALAIGRSILRPKLENERSLQDRHATMLFVDLIKHYDRLLPPTLAKKKRESERKVPQRKRTAMVDMRMRRSNISEVSDLKEAIIQQNTRRTGPGSRSSISTTTGPPESVKVLTSGQDVPSILRAGGGSSNTSPVPPSRPVVPPPPPLEEERRSVTPSLPPGFVPPPPPPSLVPGSRGNHDDYVPPPMPVFVDPPESNSPTSSPDPPSRSSSPVVVGGGGPGMPQRGIGGVKPLRTGGGFSRGLRTSGAPPGPGVRESFRPQTPPSPGRMPSSRGSYNPSAHRRTGSGSALAKKTTAPDTGGN